MASRHQAHAAAQVIDLTDSLSDALSEYSANLFHIDVLEVSLAMVR